MNIPKHSSTYYDISDGGDGGIVIHFKGEMNVGSAAVIYNNLYPLISARSPSKLTIDLNEVTEFDDYGALILAELKHLVPNGRNDFDIINVNADMNEILFQVHFETHEKCFIPQKPKRSVNILVRLGESSLTQLFNIRLMVAFLLT